MTEGDISTRIKNRLHPEPYDVDISPSGNFDFIIKSKPVIFNGKYSVGFKQLTSELTFDEFLDIRLEAQKLCKAMWLFREFGIHLIFCGPEKYWKDQTENIVADTTGVHNIIVQAIHFIDPETKSSHLNRSTWGPVKFGVGGLVSKVVEEEMKKEP